jgi:hypothetical protein
MFIHGSLSHNYLSSLIKQGLSISSKIFRKEETLNSQNQYFSNRKGSMSAGRKELNPVSTLAFTGAWKKIDRARDV